MRAAFLEEVRLALHTLSESGFLTAGIASAISGHINRSLLSSAGLAGSERLSDQSMLIEHARLLQVEPLRTLLYFLWTQLGLRWTCLPVCKRAAELVVVRACIVCGCALTWCYACCCCTCCCCQCNQTDITCHRSYSVMLAEITQCPCWYAQTAPCVLDSLLASHILSSMLTNASLKRSARRGPLTSSWTTRRSDTRGHTCVTSALTQQQRRQPEKRRHTQPQTRRKLMQTHKRLQTRSRSLSCSCLIQNSRRMLCCYSCSSSMR